MKLSQARVIADKWVLKLRPSCLRIEIAGSIRREKEDVNDIEIVVIPDRWKLEFFLMDKDNAVRLELNGSKQKKINDTINGITIDLFICTRETFGLNYLIRTGSANYCKSLMVELNRLGFSSRDARLYHATSAQLKDTSRDFWPKPLSTPEERDVYRLTGIPWKEPKDRK